MNADLATTEFKRAGIDMSHHHFAPRKTIRPRDSSRDPSPEHVHDDSSDLGEKHFEHTVVPVSPLDD